jgi:hypothetical protein
MRFSADNRLPAKMDRTEAFSLYAIFRDISRWINSGFVSVADATSDTTTWPLLAGSQTGDQQPRTDADFTYDASTNTVTFGSVTGSALGMTIQTRAPTVLENLGAQYLTLQGRTAALNNSNGQSLRFLGGAGLGTGEGGSLDFSAGTGGSGGNGGGMSFSAQAGNGVGTGGSFLAQCGGADGSGDGGFMSFSAGYADTGAGGVMEFRAGQSFSATGGNVLFSNGASGNSTASEVRIELNPSSVLGGRFVVYSNNTGTNHITADDNGSALRLGFFNATAATKPTGVAVTAAGIHAALVTLGLIAA